MPAVAKYAFSKEYVQGTDNHGTESSIYTYTRIHMIDEKEVLHLFIQSILQHIESIEDTDADIATVDELKLLLSDNLAEDGMVHVRKSLMNKTFHLSFSTTKIF
jgi:hypothetical protein